MKPKRPHTAFYTGSKIRIILRTGEVVIAKFKENYQKNRIRTFDKGDFLVSNIKSACYYKPFSWEK